MRYAADAAWLMHKLKEEWMIGTWIMGILLIVTFVGFIAYAMRGGNLTVGFFVLSVLWTGVYYIGVLTGDNEPFNFIKDTFSQPALNYGGTAVQIIFGAWFGRVLVDTGIAASISNRTAQVGEKRPVLATILVALVTCLIFTSAYGVGSAIAVGVILFPIMARIGVPKKIAVSVFTLSIGAAMWVNSVLFVQFATFFEGYQSPDGQTVEWGNHYLSFGIVAMIIQMIAVILFILLNAKKIRNGEPYEVGDPNERVETKEVPVWTYIMPIVPVALSIFLKWEAVPSLLIATILTFLFTGNMKSLKGFVEKMNGTAKVAIGDIGGLLIMLFCLTMFQAAAIRVLSGFTPILGQFIPNNELVLALAVLILAPLALFRGPLELFGAGAATVTILLGLGVFNGWFLYALLVIPSTLGVSACFTQSWNMWSVEYLQLDAKTFLKTGVPVYWIASFFIMGAASLLLF
ncbi:gluconate:proton symporter [Bifidobacterium tsurumiense]|nr:gluconate:proton symporter [Bifidobacterium tsurumiense]